MAPCWTRYIVLLLVLGNEACKEWAYIFDSFSSLMSWWTKNLSPKKWFLVSASPNCLKDLLHFSSLLLISFPSRFIPLSQHHEENFLPGLHFITKLGAAVSFSAQIQSPAMHQNANRPPAQSFVDANRPAPWGKGTTTKNLKIWASVSAFRAWFSHIYPFWGAYEISWSGWLPCDSWDFWWYIIKWWMWWMKPWTWWMLALAPREYHFIMFKSGK